MRGPRVHAGEYAVLAFRSLTSVLIDPADS